MLKNVYGEQVYKKLFQGGLALLECLFTVLIASQQQFHSSGLQTENHSLWGNISYIVSKAAKQSVPLVLHSVVSINPLQIYQDNCVNWKAEKEGAQTV